MHLLFPYCLQHLNSFPRDLHSEFFLHNSGNHWNSADPSFGQIKSSAVLLFLTDGFFVEINFVGVAGVVVKDVDKIILIGRIGDVTDGCVEDMITSSFFVVDSVVKIGAEIKGKRKWFLI